MSRKILMIYTFFKQIALIKTYLMHTIGYLSKYVYAYLMII